MRIEANHTLSWGPIVKIRLLLFTMRFNLLSTLINIITTTEFHLTTEYGFDGLPGAAAAGSILCESYMKNFQGFSFTVKEI